jgi:hypothetical protein
MDLRLKERDGNAFLISFNSVCVGYASINVCIHGKKSSKQIPLGSLMSTVTKLSPSKQKNVGLLFFLHQTRYRFLFS